MSNVIDLASRRPREACCPRHELDHLAARIADRLDDEPGPFIERTALEDVLADVLATTNLLLPQREENSRP
jgi:hypothetical protein